MNIALVYDSIFGNTGKIAEAIASELTPEHNVALVTVQEARSLDLAGIKLLIVGSPTRGFQPTPQISEYVAGLETSNGGLQAAVFDTRIDLDTVNPVPLRWVVNAGGYATDRMVSTFRDRGYHLRGEPGAFLVTSAEGPLKAGETERARAWARTLLQ